jgi:uncharacterized protein (DUF1810 family)
MDDPYNLARFVAAQQAVFARVCAELAAGAKQSHWMWFIFPQLRGLGTSALAERYGISSVDEARAYLDHPLLGSRLRECTQLVNAAGRRTAQAIFGYPDYVKFRSCMTLFAIACADIDSVFHEALQRYFAGEGDPLTVRLCGPTRPPAPHPDERA